jgi:hypothetical protein
MRAEPIMPPARLLEPMLIAVSHHAKNKNHPNWYPYKPLMLLEKFVT